MNDKNQQVAQRDNTTAPPARKPDPRGEALMALRNAFETQRDEITKTLPPQIPFERFKRVVDTSVLQNPDLLLCPPRELFNACMKAASDGLLPDGREGALVIYNMKDGKDAGGKDRWRKAVQWMPMIAGILKKVRNSGELSTIVARVVYGGDKFRNWIDNDGEHLEYEAGDQQDRNIIRCAFAMAKLKDGSIEVEVLKAADIEKIRSVSRAKDKGPWVDWWEEMAKKSALRRLSKRLPMSTDLDDIIRRDDALYDLEGARDQRGPSALPTATVQGLGNKLDMIAGATSTLVDRETGEIIDGKTTSQEEDEQHDDEATSQEDATDRQSRDRQGASEGQTEGRKEPPAQERKPDATKQQPANDQAKTEKSDSRDDQARHDDQHDDDAGRSTDEQDGEAGQSAQDDTGPTAADRERMEMEAELLSIAQTKAQKGARQLKLWLGSIDDDQLATLKRLEKQIAAYLPPDQKIEWPKR